MNVLVVVPTYEERLSLPELLPKILEHDGYRVLVVDDASPDGTADLAEEIGRGYAGRVEVMRRTGPRGLGRSYVDGFRRALETGADLVCQMDADLSHDPAYLPGLVAAAADYDLVIGSRYLHGVSVVNWPLHRLALSVAANRYVRLVTGLPARDLTGGYRCWRREALVGIPLDRVRAQGYALAVELAFEAHRAGCRIGEVPIVFVERRHGRSKLTSSVFPEAVLMPWRLRFGGPRRRA